jgi:hypothetical protein
MVSFETAVGVGQKVSLCLQIMETSQLYGRILKMSYEEKSFRNFLPQRKLRFTASVLRWLFFTLDSACLW